jgi:hypothetical protein
MNTSLSKNVIGTLVLIMSGISTVPVGACEFRISSANLAGNPTIDYDVFSAINNDRNVVIEIERVDEDVLAGVNSTMAGTAPAVPVGTDSVVACSARMQIAPFNVSALSNAGNRLNYELVANTPERLAIGSPRVAGRVRDMLPGEKKEWEFTVRIAPNQIVAHGSYAGSVLIAVGPDIPGVSEIVSANDEDLLRIEATVAASARITVAGMQGRNRVVDFGSIESGAKPLYQPALLVQSTAGYRLRFRSENKGQLIRNGGGSHSSLPYDLSVSGKSIDLNLSIAEVQFGAASVAATRIPLEFSIPDASSKKAGVYRDRVVVDIVPMIR